MFRVALIDSDGHITHQWEYSHAATNMLNVAFGYPLREPYTFATDAYPWYAGFMGAPTMWAVQQLNGMLQALLNRPNRFQQICPDHYKPVIDLLREMCDAMRQAEPGAYVKTGG